MAPAAHYLCGGIMVDSDALSFEICARQAFRKALPKATPVIMEPIMSLEVVTPEDYMGDVIGDLNKRRGQITSMDSNQMQESFTQKFR